MRHPLALAHRLHQRAVLLADQHRLLLLQLRAPHLLHTHRLEDVHLRSVRRRDLLHHLPLLTVSTSSLFSQQWVVVCLEGQHHELMHQLAGYAESLGWEG